MTYLYGDSSSSAITINYIDFLRQIVDVSVEMLLAEQRVDAARARQRELEEAVRTEVSRLEELGARVHGIIESVQQIRSGTPTARCAEVIEQASTNAVRAAVADLRSELADNVERVAIDRKKQREAYMKSLGALLLVYDLPDSSREVHLALDYGEEYTGQLRCHTPYDVSTSVDLDVSASSAFTRQVRVSYFAPGLEIHSPERVGWVRKQLKLVKNNVSKFYINELTVSATRTSFKLRATPAFNSAGYDVLIYGVEPTVEIAHRKAADAEMVAFDVAGEDIEPLADFGKKLAQAVLEIKHSRKQLLGVDVDGQPLIEHEDPAVVVERVIEAMAPVVGEIAAHSQSSSELVLRRQLDEDRREEIFLSKQELATKLADLPESLHRLFAPLDLGPIPIPGAVAESVEVSEEFSEDIAEDMAEELAEDMAEELAEDMAEELAEDMAEELAEDMAEELAEGIAGNRSGHIGDDDDEPLFDMGNLGDSDPRIYVEELEPELSRPVDSGPAETEPATQTDTGSEEPELATQSDAESEQLDPELDKQTDSERRPGPDTKHEPPAVL
ncbi:MAG: hypothetical protein MJE77_05600 [Proteobacteria bacterium]|nr:hypothetical protein [Pseudomonadota bacterium]